MYADPGRVARFYRRVAEAAASVVGRPWPVAAGTLAFALRRAQALPDAKPSYLRWRSEPEICRSRSRRGDQLRTRYPTAMAGSRTHPVWLGSRSVYSWRFPFPWRKHQPRRIFRLLAGCRTWLGFWPVMMRSPTEPVLERPDERFRGVWRQRTHAGPVVRRAFPAAGRSASCGQIRTENGERSRMAGLSFVLTQPYYPSR